MRNMAGLNWRGEALSTAQGRSCCVSVAHPPLHRCECGLPVCGAPLMLILFHYDLSAIALIGIILLIGIVKKNAIMMIDFALDAERLQGISPQESIYRACLVRFGPIMMTTMAALTRRSAPDVQPGCRFQIAPAARLRDCWRPAVEPMADALHDARRLCLPWSADGWSAACAGFQGARASGWSSTRRSRVTAAASIHQGELAVDGTRPPWS